MLEPRCSSGLVCSVATLEDQALRPRLVPPRVTGRFTPASDRIVQISRTTGANRDGPINERC